MCGHTCGFSIVPETDDDYASSRPALFMRLISLFGVMRAMGHVIRDAAWRIALSCVPWCKRKARGDWHKYTCVCSSRLLLLLFFLQRDLSSLELTISLSFILLPFYFFILH